MPAPCWPKESLASFESEDRRTLILDLWLANLDASGFIRFFPRLYGYVTARAQDDALCPLHDDPSAMWAWRPCVHFIDMNTAVLRMGSQQELEYRAGLLAAFETRAFEENSILEEWVAARFRAIGILLEHLDPQQQIDYWASSKFYVRGHINKLYEIDVSNGFAIVAPETREIVVKYCCHPEYWMPHEDVALAIKLAIDSDMESERELLEAGHPTIRSKRRRPSQEESYAWSIEKEMFI